MTIGAASETYLGELHEKIAKRLTIHVEDVESDPRYMQMAIKFCSDNKITVVPNETNAVGTLTAALKNREKRIFAENVTDLSTAVAEKMIKEG